MAVGRLLHRKIEPVARVRVGPDLHHAAREQMALLGRDTVEHAVDHRGGLGTGDVALWAERAVGIARDPAVARGEPDVRLRPVARDVREAALALVELGEQRDDLCHLRARDGRVGAERTVGIAVHDTGLRHGGNRGVIPRVKRHVGISVGLGQVRAAALLRQQAEEDGRRLGAGDLAIRLHRAVRITDDVGEVVVRVQTERIIVFNLHGGLGGGGRVLPCKGSVDRVVLHHIFKRVRAHRADAYAVHQHVLDAVAGIGRDGKGLAFALGYGDCARGGDLAVLVGRCGNDTHFIDLDLQRIIISYGCNILTGAKVAEVVTALIKTYRIIIFYDVTANFNQIVVVVCSGMIHLRDRNGVILNPDTMQFSIRFGIRKQFWFFRATRAVYGHRYAVISKISFVPPAILKVDILVFFIALLREHQRMRYLHTERMLLAVTDGYGEELVSINRLGFSIHKVRDCGVL